MKPNKRGQDFKALNLKLTEKCAHPHVIYIKEHTVREHSEAKPPGRTLLVLNVPPYANRQGLTNAFSDVGNIENIIFTDTTNTIEDEPKRFMEEKMAFGFKLAFIVFSKVADLDRALQLQELKPLNYNNYVTPMGMAKWIEEYNASIIPMNDLQDRIDSYMKGHDEATQLAELMQKELEKADDEGWVTVTKGGKIKSFARTDNVEKKLAKKARKKKKKELGNFYVFQKREAKMKRIVELRQKYEEDKSNIAKMKEKRRFRPF